MDHHTVKMREREKEREKGGVGGGGKAGEMYLGSRAMSLQRKVEYLWFSQVTKNNTLVEHVKV